MEKVGSLVVELSASFAKFQADLGKATVIAERASGRISSALSGVGRILGAAIGTGAIVALAKRTIDAAEALSELSDRSGISVESLAGFQYAATQTGASTEDFAKALKTLNKNISEAGTGNKALRGLFQDLGMEAASRGAINAEQALLQLADVFPRLNDADKVRVAMDLLGKAGEALVPALSGGKAELEGLISTGQRLNPITQEQAKLADDFKDSVDRLSLAIGASLLPALDRILPVLEAMNGNMADSAGKSNVMSSAMTGLGRVFETIVVLGSEVAFVMRGVGTEIGGIAAQMGALARLDFAGFSNIGKAMRDDAAVARAEHDRFIAGVLGAEAKAKQQREALALLESTGVGLGREGRVRDGGKQNIKLTPTVSGKSNKSKSPSKSDGERFLANLKDQVATFGLAESALLRYQAAQAKVSVAAEPLIKELETKKGLEVLKEFRAENQDYLKDIDFENALIGESATAQRILTEARVIDQKVRELSKNATPELIKQLEDEAESLKKNAAARIENSESRKKLESFKTDNKQYLDDLEFETSLLGKNNVAQRILTEARAIDQRVKDLIVGASPEMVAQLEAEAEATKEITRALIEAQNQKERSAEFGKQSAFDEYLDKATNAAQQTKDLWTNAFKASEDALVEFVMTGKLNFKSLAASIIADIVRIQAQQMISGLFGSIFGGGGGMSGSTFAGAASFDLFHEGGVAGMPFAPKSVGKLGPKEVPAILERGEGIFTERQMKRLIPISPEGFSLPQLGKLARGTAKQRNVDLFRYHSGGIAGSVSRYHSGGVAHDEPVKTQQSGNSAGSTYNVTVNVAPGTPSEVRRAAGQGAREALTALSGAQRYS